MVFPIKRYSNFEGWIPETDLDGIDADDKYLSNMNNVDFNNGFLSVAKVPSPFGYPTLINNLLSTYNIAKSKLFTHSSKGEYLLYVLISKTLIATSYRSIRFVIHKLSDNSTQEVTIYKTTSGTYIRCFDPSYLAPAMTYDEFVKAINFNQVYDEIKINFPAPLRVTKDAVTANTNPVTVNLSTSINLYYNDKDIKYTASIGIPTGWHLTDRLLDAGIAGYSLTNNTGTLDFLNSKTSPDLIAYSGATLALSTLPNGEKYATSKLSDVSTLGTIKISDVLEMQSAGSSASGHCYIAGGVQDNFELIAKAYNRRNLDIEGVGIEDPVVWELQITKPADLSRITFDYLYTHILSYDIRNIPSGLCRNVRRGMSDFYADDKYAKYGLTPECIGAVTILKNGKLEKKIELTVDNWIEVGSNKRVWGEQVTGGGYVDPVNIDENISYRHKTDSTFEYNFVNSTVNDVYTIAVILPFYQSYRQGADVDKVLGSCSFHLTNMHIEYASQYCLVGKTYNGQRMLLKTGGSSIDDLRTFMLESHYIDTRIVQYEVYETRDNINNLVLKYDLLGSIVPFQVESISPYRLISKSGSDFEVDEVETLNFNYGLGNDVYVGAGGMYGKVIKSEIFYKNRVYFTTGNNRIYQSHIAGSGLPQPDSFPINEDIMFGYNEIPVNDGILALAVTQMEEIFIFTSKDLYAYEFEAGQNRYFKKLKQVIGSKGLLARNNVSLEINNHSSAPLLCWLNNEGIYLHSTGINNPIDITEVTHKNYYLNLLLANKINAITFYNKLKNEIWICVGTDILVYELSFKKFKKYNFGFTVTDYVGSTKDSVLIMTSEGIKSIVMGSLSHSDNAYIETHYTSCNGEGEIYPEHLLKQLRSMFVACKSIDNTVDVVNYPALTLYADGYQVEGGDNILMFCNRYKDAVSAPYNLKFGKLKMKLTLPNAYVELRELGFGFNADYDSMNSLIEEVITSTGYGYGYGTDYGNQL